MNLIRIDLKKLSSSIFCDFSISEDNTILYGNISGKYRMGSEGNPDGLYLFSLITAYYFVYEPISIIIDLRSLEYSWGNTILKSLNFFDEIGRDSDEKDKSLIIIYSEGNKQAINRVLERLIDGQRILCEGYDEAIALAVKNVEEYLG